MKMDEDDRKKLETFWRRKLWLGLAAVGAIGLAAWRVAAVQDRYDDVLVQESRELPEKVYQELLAEVRKGVPIVPVISPGTDTTAPTYGRKSRCDAIEALGFLEDSRAISELKKILNDGLSRARSCSHRIVFRDEQVNSAYTAASISLGKFNELEAREFFRDRLSALPPTEVISVWRQLHDRELGLSTLIRGFAKTNEDYFQAYTKPLTDFQFLEKDRVIQRMIPQEKSVQMSLQKKIQLDFESFGNPNSSAAQKDSAKEELFKNYSASIFYGQFSQMLRGLNANDITDDQYSQDLVLRIFTTSGYEQTVSKEVLNKILSYPKNRLKILSLFVRDYEDESSNQFLSSIRQSLVSLVGGKELLLEITLIDIRKGRFSTPNLELIPGVSKITPKVIQYLSHSNPKIRSSAASALGSIKNPGNIPILIKALNDKGHTVRNSAAVALGQIKDDRASSALEQAFKMLNRPALSGFRKTEKLPFVDHLNDFLYETSEEGKKTGFNSWEGHSNILESIRSTKGRTSLSKILKPQEIVQITEILKSDLMRKDMYYADSVIMPYVSCHSASILLDFGSELGVENCLEKIRKESEQLSQKIDIFLKSQVTSNLGLGGHEILSGHDLSWTELSLLRLKSRNYPYDSYILSPLFVKLAIHPDIQIRRAAFLNLALYSDLQNQDLPLLLNGLQDSDSVVRRFSAYYFSRGFFKNEKVLPALLKASWDSDVKTRQFTISALKRIELPEAKTRIVKALDDPAAIVRSTAALMLDERDAQKNSPELLSLLQKDPDAQVRSQVASTLGNSSKEILLDATLIALQDRDRNVNSAGISMLNKLIENQTSLDSRFGIALVDLLRKLNTSKDIPVEDWTSSLIGNDSFKIEALSTLSKLSNRNALNEVDRSKAIPILMSMYKTWRNTSSAPQRATIVKIIRKLNESEKVDRTAQQRTQQLFYLETGILGAIGVTAIGLLLSSIRLRNPFSLFFSTYLLFPEEVVAELIALKQRRQSEKVRRWQIRLELAYEIITLIWAFHIQIRIDDLKLPPGGNRSAK